MIIKIFYTYYSLDNRCIYLCYGKYPKMNNTLIFCFMITFVLVQSRMRPKTKPTPKPEPFIAEYLRQKSHKAFPNLRVPNKQFCSDRPLKPAEHYLVLPWWYHYCQSLMDKKAKKYEKGVYYLPLYKNILDRLQAYKRNKMLKQQWILRKQMEAVRDPMA